VQWHFACVYNVWSKRALASAGFGYPTFETADGRPQHFKPIYSLADMSQSPPAKQLDDQEQPREKGKKSSTRRGSAVAQDVESGRLGGLTDDTEKLHVKTLEVIDDGKITKDQTRRMEAIHGINRPFFHPDIQSALTSAIASKIIMEAFKKSSASLN
jgi:solute carrier family 26 (sodium-independent sulfate anion transporter), member 11